MTSPIELLGEVRLLPIVRTASGEEALAATHRLIAAGVPIVELTATMPGWEETLAAACLAHPDVVIGMGTIADAASAQRAIEAGARFLVSPFAAPGARAVASGARVPFLGGALTPTEVAASSAHGAAKLFPAHVGGPAYLTSLLAVMPGRRLVPTGGIALADVPAWLAAGAYAVGVGSDLLAHDDLEAAFRRAVGARLRPL